MPAENDLNTMSSLRGVFVQNQSAKLPSKREPLIFIHGTRFDGILCGLAEWSQLRIKSEGSAPW